MHSFDGLDRKRGRKSPIANLDPGGSIRVHPSNLPASVVALKIKKRSEINLVPHAHIVADQDPHRQRQGITLYADPLRYPLFQQRTQATVQIRVSRLLQETRKEEEEALRRCIITGPIEVSPVHEHAVHPLQRVRQIAPATVRVEQAEDVHAYNWIKTWSIMIEVGLKYSYYWAHGSFSLNKDLHT